MQLPNYSVFANRKSGLLNLDEIAKELNMSKRNHQRALRIYDIREGGAGKVGSNLELNNFTPKQKM